MVLSRPVWILVEESTMQPVKVPPASMHWSSSKTAPKWLSLGAVQASPDGGLTSYDHAVSFAFPNPQNLTLTTELNPPSGGSIVSWSRNSLHPSTVELELNVLHGAPELPSKMFARAETFGARYGNYYGFAWFPAGKFGHNQLDWGPDGQEINALYIGANGQSGYVAPGAGGTQNGYTPRLWPSGRAYPFLEKSSPKLQVTPSTLMGRPT